MFIFLSVVMLALSCTDPVMMTKEELGSLTNILYQPTPVTLNYPSNFGQTNIPEDNPITKEGVALGKKLFFDPILSQDSTMSCSFCHKPNVSFTDIKTLSTGVNGMLGKRNSMPIINLVFNRSNKYFWDGRAKSLEEQAMGPIESDIELHNTFPDLIKKLKARKDYTEQFRKAFGISNIDEITKELIVKAIAQFERTLISKDTKFDKILRGEAKFTDLELYGYTMFIDEDPNIKDAECSHCHSLPLTTSNQFFNNGLVEAPTLNEFKDFGLGGITGLNIDKGKFKAPSLRNIEHTAPYMHDGRFETIDEVIEHYNSGGKPAPNKDPLIFPLNLTTFEKRALKAFLSTLSDSTFMNNPAFIP